QPTGSLERIVDRTDDILSRRLDCGRRLLCQCSPGNGQDRTVQVTGVDKTLRDQLDSACPVKVEGGVASARAKVAYEWCRLANAVEVVDGERDTGFACEGEKVEHHVGRAAGGGCTDDAVFDGLTRDDVSCVNPAAED